MTDEVKTTPTSATTSPPPAASQSVPSTSSSPALAASSAPASVAPTADTAASIPSVPVVEPTTAPAPIQEKPTEQAPEVPKPETPLGTDPEAPKDEPVPEVKVDQSAEEENPSDPKKEEPSQSAEPAPLPTFESFKLPEGISPDQDGFSHLNKMLGEFEIKTGASHEEVQSFGQNLVDRHVAHLQDTIKKVSDAWTQNWEDQKKNWFESFKSDPEIGGNRMDTSLSAARQFIRTHGGTPQQQQEFRELMNVSGVGNHPAIIRMLAKASSAMSEGRPLPASSPVSEKKGRAATLYGGR